MIPSTLQVAIKARDDGIVHAKEGMTPPHTGAVVPDMKALARMTSRKLDLPLRYLHVVSVGLKLDGTA